MEKRKEYRKQSGRYFVWPARESDSGEKEEDEPIRFMLWLSEFENEPNSICKKVVFFADSGENDRDSLLDRRNGLCGLFGFEDGSFISEN